MQRQAPERSEQQQEGRRIGERVVAVRIHAERDLPRMQRVGVEIDRGVAAMGDEGRGPQREEIAEMIGLVAFERRLHRHEHIGEAHGREEHRHELDGLARELHVERTA